MLGTPKPAPRAGSGLHVTVLAVVMLGAMAFAIPPAPIKTTKDGFERGLLVSHMRFSDLMAEQIANNGYTYLAIDVTLADTSRDALWRAHLDVVESRRFDVWGYCDLRGEGEEQARAIVRSLNLAGLFVYGPDAVRQAAALRRERAGLRVVPIVRPGGAPPKGEHAVALDRSAFVATDAKLPVLIADQLDAAAVADARKQAKGSYLIADVAILE